ncbi:MAG: hypothetical protein ACLTXI_01325 [Collinsella sp.]
MRELGLMATTRYMHVLDEVGNVPAMGDVLSWSESSAVVYANWCWARDATATRASSI